MTRESIAFESRLGTTGPAFPVRTTMIQSREHRIASTVALIAMFVCVGCIQRSEQSATIYCATDREFAAPILDAFERANFKENSENQKDSKQVVRVFDVEASKTLGLVTRIEQEATQPKCDVFWNNEILHTIRLQKAGLLEPRRWSLPDGWPEGFLASDRSWVGFAARARILIINTEKLSDKALWPTSVQELASEKWKGKCGYANPVYGTTATHFAILASHPESLREVQWSEWSSDVRKNAVMLAGNKQVALAVASGELAWGLTDTDDAVIEKEKGMPIEMVFPDQLPGQFGAIFIPNTVAVIRKAPHPVLAAKLADYLVSEKTESRLAMSSSAHFPIWPGAKEQSRIETLGIRRAKVDFERAAQEWESLQQNRTAEASTSTVQP
jgi:iron(III) transport system substrate-binding protein